MEIDWIGTGVVAGKVVKLGSIAFSELRFIFFHYAYKVVIRVLGNLCLDIWVMVEEFEIPLEEQMEA